MIKYLFVILFFTITTYAQKTSGSVYIDLYGKSKTHIIKVFEDMNLEFSVDDKMNYISGKEEEFEVYYYFNNSNACYGVTVFYNKNFYHISEIRELLLTNYPFSDEDKGEYYDSEEIAIITDMKSDESALNRIMVMYRPIIN